MNCPKCNSVNTHFRSNRNNYICDECDEIFEKKEEFRTLRVFVSYGHDKYLTFARKVATEIKERGHEVWFDEERLKPGRIWEDYIEEGLEWVAADKEIGRIVLIMTPHSVRRPDGYCLNEIAKALDNNVKIIPVMLIWTTPPLSIYRLQWLDSTHSWNGDTLHEVFTPKELNRICEVLEKDTLDKEGVMCSLYHALEPLDFNADLALNQTWFTGRQWVFDHIEKWMGSEEASRLFCITGIPGIGKTVIATHLLQKFPNIVAFHLCRRNNNEKASPFRAICTIAYQLASQLPEYKMRLTSINIRNEIERSNENALFDSLIIQPLSHVCSPSKIPLVILIDGLDEASYNGKNSMANFIAAEFHKLPKWLRIIITTRPNAEVITPLKSFRPWTLNPHSPENQQDISGYIDLRLKDYHSLPNYEHVKSMIMKNAQGVFLYVSTLCDDILNKRLSFKKPESFPESMGRYYYEFFEEKFKDIQKYRKDIRPALELLLAVCEPLNREQIALFLHWGMDEVNDWLHAMGSLLLLDTDDHVVPFHASLYDWLDNEKDSYPFYADKRKGHHYIMSVDRSDKRISSYLFKYLPSHFLLSSDEDGFIHLFTEGDFLDRRRQNLSTFNFLQFYFNELSFFRTQFVPDHIYSLFDSDIFRQIVIDYDSFMFDKEYHLKLRDIGFSNYLETQDESMLPITFRVFLISYYYIIRRIDKAIKFDIDVLNIDSLDSLDKKTLELYSLAFNMLGVCCRIVGVFEKARNYIAMSVQIHKILGNKINESIVEANLARVYEMNLDFETSEKILLHGVLLVEEQSFNPDSSDSMFDCIHMYNGSMYILAEHYLNMLEWDKALVCLQAIGRLYTKPEYIDRYWPRYLYSMAIYYLFKGNSEEAGKFLDEAERISQDNNKLDFVRALYMWTKGIESDDQNVLLNSKDLCEKVMHSFKKNYLLENYAEALALYKHICNHLHIDFSYDEEMDLRPFENWIGFKYKWLEEIPI